MLCFYCEAPTEMAEVHNIPAGSHVFWESQQCATVMPVMLNDCAGRGDDDEAT